MRQWPTLREVVSMSFVELSNVNLRNKAVVSFFNYTRACLFWKWHWKDWWKPHFLHSLHSLNSFRVLGGTQCFHERVPVLLVCSRTGDGEGYSMLARILSILFRLHISMYFFPSDFEKKRKKRRLLSLINLCQETIQAQISDMMTCRSRGGGHSVLLSTSVRFQSLITADGTSSTNNT